MSNYDSIVNKLALKYRIPTHVMKKLVESQFEFIHETIRNLDFTKVDSKEQFDEMKTNFNIKYLFKLYANYTKIKVINKYRKLRDEKNENKNISN